MKFNPKFRSLFLLFLLLLLPATTVSAGTLTEPVTGLALEAPKGAKLSGANGIYTLRYKKSYVRFMAARSPLSLADTVSSYIKLAKIKKSKKSRKGGGTQVAGTLKNKPVIVKFTPSGGTLLIATFGGKTARQAPTKILPRSALLRRVDVTIADIAVLQRAINSRRGGITVPLNLTVPMRRFTAPDGGSSALVPDLPGWTYQGGGGVISGSNFAQGVLSLGVPVAVSVPGFGGAPPISNFVGPDTAIVTVWPQYVKVISGIDLQVLSVALVPGTQGWLGQNFQSGLYAVRFAFNGQTWQALMASGSTTIPGLTIGWMWYSSYIAVPENGPGGIGPALIDSWASWDNTGASQARLNQALQTLLSIRVTGYPIDPVVFEEAANAWSEYIRG